MAKYRQNENKLRIKLKRIDIIYAPDNRYFTQYPYICKNASPGLKPGRAYSPKNTTKYDQSICNGYLPRLLPSEGTAERPAPV